MIHVIHHHESVGVVHAHALRTHELTRSRAITSQHLQQSSITIATWVINLHHMQTTHRRTHKPIQIHTNPKHTTTNVNLGDGLATISTPHHHSLVVGVGHHEERRGRRGRSKATIQMANISWIIQILRTTSFLANGVHKATRRIKLLDSVVVSVSHHDGAIRGTTDAIGCIKLTLGSTRSTPIAPDGVEWLVMVTVVVVPGVLVVGAAGSPKSNSVMPLPEKGASASAMAKAEGLAAAAV